MDPNPPSYETNNLPNVQNLWEIRPACPYIAPSHDTGAIYDLVKPARNAMKPAGQWNHVVIACDKGQIRIELNGEPVTAMDLDQWSAMSRRPDGTRHKFDVAWKDHPRKGYIGLQDHGKDCWFKNIKLKALPD